MVVGVDRALVGPALDLDSTRSGTRATLVVGRCRAAQRSTELISASRRGVPGSTGGLRVLRHGDFNSSALTLTTGQKRAVKRTNGREWSASRLRRSRVRRARMFSACGSSPVRASDPDSIGLEHALREVEAVLLQGERHGVVPEEALQPSLGANSSEGCEAISDARLCRSTCGVSPFHERDLPLPSISTRPPRGSMRRHRSRGKFGSLNLRIPPFASVKNRPCSFGFSPCAAMIASSSAARAVDSRIVRMPQGDSWARDLPHRVGGLFAVETPSSACR